MHFLLVAVLVVIVVAILARSGDGGAVTRLASVIYWVASGVAILAAGFAAYALAFGTGDQRFFVDWVLVIFGALVWLGGWALRYILTGKRRVI